MAIQNRRGDYNDFDPQKLVPGEWAVVLSGDPNSTRGKAVYMAFDAGDVERMATYEDMQENIVSATSDIQEQFAAELTQTIDNANSAVTDMRADVDAEIASATDAVNALTFQINTATNDARSSSAEAISAANEATEAAESVQAIIDAGQTVYSWNNRVGLVTPAAGDYNSSQITHGNETVADALEFDTTPVANSAKAVQSGGVYAYIQSLLNGFTVVNYPSGSMKSINASGIYYVYNGVTDKPDTLEGLFIYNKASQDTGCGLYVPNSTHPTLYKVSVAGGTWTYVTISDMYGSPMPHVVQLTNCNNGTDPRLVYYLDSDSANLNKPSGSGWIFLRCFAISGNNMMQIATTMGPSTSTIWVRSRSSTGVWGDWEFIPTVSTPPYKWKSASYTASNIESGYTAVTTNIKFPALSGFGRVIVGITSNSAYTGVTGYAIDSNNNVVLRCRNFSSSTSSPTISFVMMYVRNTYQWT